MPKKNPPELELKKRDLCPCFKCGNLFYTDDLKYRNPPIRYCKSCFSDWRQKEIYHSYRIVEARKECYRGFGLKQGIKFNADTDYDKQIIIECREEWKERLQRHNELEMPDNYVRKELAKIFKMPVGEIPYEVHPAYKTLIELHRAIKKQTKYKIERKKNYYDKKRTNF